MSMDQGSETPRPRQSILRGVYESNLRLSGHPDAPPPSAPGADSQRHRRLRWLLVLPLIAAAVTFAAFDKPAPPTATIQPVPTGKPVAAESVTGTATKDDHLTPTSTNEASPPLPVVRLVSEAPSTGHDFLPSPANGIALPSFVLLAANSQSRHRPSPRPATTTVSTPGDLAVYAGPLAEPGLTLRNIFGLGVRTIVIDPGHGGRDPGTSGKLGTREKDVTLDVALRLKTLLQHDNNFRVLLTRETDTSTSLSKRVELANASAVDLFISIHVNYLTNSTLNVIETYYFGAHSDPEALRLAERENHGSDYSMSDFESLVRNMRDTIKLQESQRLATSIQSSLTGNMQRTHRELLDVGTKTAPFVVLLGVKAPAVLAEISCMCNLEAEQRLKTPEHREEIARYIAEGIINYLQENANKGDESDDRQRQAKKS